MPFSWIPEIVATRHRTYREAGDLDTRDSVRRQQLRHERRRATPFVHLQLRCNHDVHAKTLPCRSFRATGSSRAPARTGQPASRHKSSRSLVFHLKDNHVSSTGLVFLSSHSVCKA